jgi:mono/diheme cytochrome c family protein
VSAAEHAPLRRENPDPHESKNPVPPLFLVFFGIVTSFAFLYLAEHGGKDPAFAGDQRSIEVPTTHRDLGGPEIFEARCAACHQSSGLGVPHTFPPLAGSPWLVGDEETPIRIVLLGIEGKIDVRGDTYDGTMPRFGDQLSDAEIARVLTHERSSWGNRAQPVTEEAVARVRASLEGRSEPWKGGAELASVRPRAAP